MEVRVVEAKVGAVGRNSKGLLNGGKKVR